MRDVGLGSVVFGGTASATIRSPRDPDVPAHPFKLRGCAGAGRRQQGFESWQALREGLQAMSDSTAQTTTRPVITAVAAELFVSDIQKSCDFFTRKLGFTLVFTYGEPPFYGQVKRDAARLNLKCMDRPVIDPELREREQLLSADMGVDTADAIKQLYLEFQQAGVEFQQTLMRQPWGANNFVVRDPDGNLLLFAGPAE